MTRYDDDLDCPVAFGEQLVDDTLAEIARQRRPAAAPRRGDREVRPRDVLPERRPRRPVARRDACARPLATGRGDVRPEAGDVGCRGRRAASSRSIDKGAYAFAIVNFANPDMVGHTGVIPAVVEAVETADGCLGEVVDAVHNAAGVTADHGRPRKRRAAARGGRQVSPHTAHTTNLVPAGAHRRRRDAARRRRARRSCADVPRLLGLDVPSSMTGKSLVIPAVSSQRLNTESQRAGAILAHLVASAA